MSAGAYEILNVIGSGSFGRVSKIRRKSDGKILVWKELHYGGMSDKEKQMLVSEVNILREFRHPHIVRYYDRIIDRERKVIYIVMEYCENGDLATYIKRCRRELVHVDEDTIWRIFAQVTLALKECHQRPGGKVLHRDLKPGNIFLDAQKNVKLGDFGLARILSKSSKFAHTNVGTPYYMSPEQVNERAYNEKSDIWSLGCLVYEMAALSPPFEASNQIALAMKIRAGSFRDLPSRYSSDLNRIVRRMLQVNQSRRPTVDELLALPQVVLYLRERKVSQQYASLKRKEEELAQREAALEERERAVKKREDELAGPTAGIRDLLKRAAPETLVDKENSDPSAEAAAGKADAPRRTERICSM